MPEGVIKMNDLTLARFMGASRQYCLDHNINPDEEVVIRSGMSGIQKTNQQKIMINELVQLADKIRVLHNQGLV